MKFFRGFLKKYKKLSSPPPPPDFLRILKSSRRTFFKSLFFKTLLLLGLASLVKKNRFALITRKSGKLQNPFQNLNINELVLPQAHATPGPGCHAPPRKSWHCHNPTFFGTCPSGGHTHLHDPCSHP